jgi:hypothetical protein
MKRLFDQLFIGDNTDDPNREFVQNVLHHLDYNRSMVGGSYALKTLLKAKWEYNDVDVFIECTDVKDFDNETERVQASFNKHAGPGQKLKLIKERLPTDQVTEDELDKVERFHECILKTRNYDTDPPTKPIQFVGIQKEHWRFKGTFEASLCAIVDAPSVFMKYGGNTELRPMYIIPEKSFDAIISKEINKYNICSKRAKKYAERGFNITE